jgi:hypothetical protein
MSTKKTAPSLATESGLVQQNCTSRKGKGSEIPQELQEQGWQEVPLEKRIRYQRQKISAALSVQSEMGATRMMIARATDIERANVCRRVAELRKEGRIWICGKHPCKITGARAEYLTCDQHTAFEYYLNATSSIWAALPTEDERHEIQDAIWQYVIDRKTELDFFGLNTSAVREMWDEVKSIIDKEVRQ